MQTRLASKVYVGQIRPFMIHGAVDCERPRSSSELLRVDDDIFVGYLEIGII